MSEDAHLGSYSVKRLIELSLSSTTMGPDVYSLIPSSISPVAFSKNKLKVVLSTETPLVYKDVLPDAGRLYGPVMLIDSLDRSGPDVYRERAVFIMTGLPLAYREGCPSGKSPMGELMGI